MASASASTSAALRWRALFDSRRASQIVATLFGMALGGWMSGKVFDLSGSYQAAFVNGIVWNLINLSVTVFLLRRTLRPPALPPSALGASA